MESHRASILSPIQKAGEKSSHVRVPEPNSVKKKAADPCQDQKKTEEKDDRFYEKGKERRRIEGAGHRYRPQAAVRVRINGSILKGGR